MCYKRPALSGENWGKISAFCEMSQADTSLGCGTMSLSLESTSVLRDCPTHKFGHLLFALPLHEGYNSSATSLAEVLQEFNC